MIDPIYVVWFSSFLIDFNFSPNYIMSFGL
jgi:hypothetical protein